MIDFSILKRSTKSRARVGILKTPHGEVETPAFVTVATRAVIRTLTTQEAHDAGSPLIICNTFHLHFRPGEAIVAENGGLHDFMQWKRPIMTDSGGFQVFSFGFGRDYQVGKVTKFFPGEGNNPVIGEKSQPKDVKITPDGVYFRSPLSGEKRFIGPRESIAIQEQLGADIIFAFDECTSPFTTPAYLKKSLERTHTWAEICLRAQTTKQALYGIVQGSHYKELREQSASFIGNLDFPGFGIGGDLGCTQDDMMNILDWTMPFLPEEKPRHLLGIGYLKDMEDIIARGIDTFDCVVPTQLARHGVAFTSEGRFNMRNARFVHDLEPLDKTCPCPVCQTYKRSYISHLIRAGESSGLHLLTLHNLHFFNRYVASLRERIKEGTL